jgi:FlaG/FlaF family flagellin (archaellin)
MGRWLSNDETGICSITSNRILLMLVVTIIIAAVVSSFAGGFASGSSKAPQARLAVSPSISNIQDEDTTNWVSDFQMVLLQIMAFYSSIRAETPFSLTDVNVQIQVRILK